MRAAIVAFTLIVLAGCEPRKEAMTNDQVIAETTKCLKANMLAQPLMYEGRGPIVMIQCKPK